MSKLLPTLHLLCGKIASGKSTLARELAKTPDTVILSEDTWLAHLYPEGIKTVTDYVRCASNLRGAIGPHVTDLLRIGVSVVLDFPANTIANRKWMRYLIDRVESAHVLHFLDVSDDKCLTRLRARNRSDTHAFVVTDTEFDLITSYFVAPQQEEGFNIIRY
ncbi:cell division protein ZipA [Methylomonas sp. LWB]|uniref:AAA family ATPase n=1 Tax=Methylomonas sp. LWB TaxID=1905845 RepID=UPI0008D9619E|nr:ATP-binding protein [Methylomonas sp. LWB]OHX37017.1 cell division protein ZipA [Methylomonas sp. LWB]